MVRDKGRMIKYEWQDSEVKILLSLRSELEDFFDSDLDTFLCLALASDPQDRYSDICQNVHKILLK